MRATASAARGRPSRVSVERVARKGGHVWRVRWRDDLGRERSKVLGRKADAQLFDAEITRRKRVGTLPMLDAGQETLGEFVERWWALYARTQLSEKTRRTYASLWGCAHLPAPRRVPAAGSPPDPDRGVPCRPAGRRRRRRLDTKDDGVAP